ncbi:MAG: hypothetical protein MJY75_05665 [Bacteroidaceae bacterium]|nr:hypothetical protein [Bacteroidaceae bacterium]
MHRLFPALLCAATLLLHTGCEKDTVETESNGSGHDGRTGHFLADIPESVGFSCWGTPLSFIVDTDRDTFAVTADSAWCHTSSDKYSFTLSLDEYTPESGGTEQYTAMRSCNVTVTCDSIFSRTFKVYQESRTFIRVPQDTVFLSADGDSLDITVYNNCYAIMAESSDTSWLKVSVTDNSTLTLASVPRPADSHQPRQAQVRVMSQLSEGIYRFDVRDADSGLDSQDYGYGGHTDWD